MASHFFKRVVATLSSAALGAALLAAMATPVHAQTGTIRLLVGFPPGGGTDVIARCWPKSSRTSWAPM
jgi:tripartite-type tricarboxylate transporter receptor subunit TctC